MKVEESEKKAEVLIIYHKDCYDGFAAAHSARKYYELDGVDTLAMDYYDGAPLDLVGKYKRVVIVDFSFDLDVIKMFLINGAKVTMIDHHKTAFAYWKPIIGDDPYAIPGAEIYMTPGIPACIAADTMFNHTTISPPHLYNLIADRDNWTFEYPETRVIMEALFARGMHMREKWLEFQAVIEIVEDYHQFGYEAEKYQLYASLYELGNAILVQKQLTVDSHVTRNTKFISFAGYEGIPICNAPYHLRSDVGEALYNLYKTPFAMTYDDHWGKGFRKYSLRSKKGTVDVSVIAKSMGGGGHENAASFSIPLRDDDRAVNPFI